MLLVILLAAFGIIALTRGEMKITNGRRVSGSNSKILGAILLAGAVGNLFIGGIGLIALIVAIVAGLALSEKIESAPSA